MSLGDLRILVHDSINDISIIGGYVSILQKSNNLTEEQKEYLQYIRDSNLKLNNRLKKYYEDNKEGVTKSAD